MGLTSASTLTDALAQYNDNLGWDGDATKAALALEAVRWLLANRALSQGVAGVSINFSDLRDEKTKLESFVSATKSTANRASFVKGRALLR